jgi:hypothetical protein
MLQILRRWQSTLSKNAIIVLNNGQHTLRAKKIGLTGFNRARAQSSENWIIWQKRRCHQINPLIRAKTESSQAGRPDVFEKKNASKNYRMLCLISKLGSIYMEHDFCVAPCCMYDSNRHR